MSRKLVREQQRALNRPRSAQSLLVQCFPQDIETAVDTLRDECRILYNKILLDKVFSWMDLDRMIQVDIVVVQDFFQDRKSQESCIQLL
jgi:hypothetical protein